MQLHREQHGERLHLPPLFFKRELRSWWLAMPERFQHLLNVHSEVMELSFHANQLREHAVSMLHAERLQPSVFNPLQPLRWAQLIKQVISRGKSQLQRQAVRQQP